VMSERDGSAVYGEYDNFGSGNVCVPRCNTPCTLQQRNFIRDADGRRLIRKLMGQ